METATGMAPRIMRSITFSLCCPSTAAACFLLLFSTRAASYSSSLHASRPNSNHVLSLSSSFNSRLFQHNLAMESLLERPTPIWTRGRVGSSERRMTMQASLAADQEIFTKSEAHKPLVVLPTNESSENLLKIRHTSAHVLAMAVQKLFPEAQVAIGPWIEKGFYYDFDTKEPFVEEDLKKIKKEMDRIISRNLALVREDVSREEAEKRIKAVNEPYKLEI